MLKHWLPSTQTLLQKWNTTPQYFQSREKKLVDLVGPASARFKNEPKLSPFFNIGESLLFRNLISKTLQSNSGHINRIIDFGCGSSLPTISAILDLPTENYPDDVLAVDINHDAILASEHNATAAGLEKIYRIRQADMFTYFNKSDEICADLIVANPPYVSSPKEAAKEFFTPVNGGEDGLRFLRPILQLPIKSGTLVAIVAGTLSSPSQLGELIETSFRVISCDSYIVPFQYASKEPLYSYLKSLRENEVVDFFQLEAGEDGFITFTLLLEKK